MKLCAHCGQVNRSEANYCCTCGFELQEAAPVAEAMGQTGRLHAGAVVQGRYYISQQIGEGGLGRVFLAQDEAGRRYALKQIREMPPPDGQAGDDIYLRSFQREAHILSSLPHPYLPIARDFIVAPDSLIIVMDYIEGRTLADELDALSGPLPEGKVLSWAVQVCEALIYLHSKHPPIIHRNIKPKNIILEAGENPRVRLIGFGLARYYAEDLERDEDNLGTKGYSPPEQYGLAQTDPRSDIFGLGATLYALLTHRDPAEFINDEDPQNIAFHFPELAQVNPQVSEATSHAVMKALCIDPQERFQSAAEMKAALEAILFPPPASQAEEVRFNLGMPVALEETRSCEFKEVKGEEAIRAVIRIIDIYVVAFLNSEGGRIYWGIRDDDRCVVGVKLTYRQRDALRRAILDKAMRIQPAISPSAYRITFHPVFDGDRSLEDLYVVEVHVPGPTTRMLYFTDSGEVYVKTEAGKKKLTGVEIQDEILRRLQR